MNYTIPRVHRTTICFVAMATLLFALPGYIHAQRGRGAQPPATARAAAPIDLTGYWVSIVTEDWIWRMTTPKKGDFGFGTTSPDAVRSSVPINDAARRAALNWDPAKDEAEGNQCKWYGAANIMRVPGRLHITWENDNTLRIDTDAGTQTRLFQFGRPPAQTGPRTWQGYSVAEWEGLSGWEQRNLGRLRPGLWGAAGEGPRAHLKVVTTGMKAGYLRRNGVPYSENAIITEHFRRVTDPKGDTWLIITTLVEDSQYLVEPFLVSTNFKRIPDASGWNPTPCTAR